MAYRSQLLSAYAPDSEAFKQHDESFKKCTNLMSDNFHGTSEAAKRDLAAQEVPVFERLQEIFNKYNHLKGPPAGGSQQGTPAADLGPSASGPSGSNDIGQPGPQTYPNGSSNGSIGQAAGGAMPGTVAQASAQHMGAVPAAGHSTPSSGPSVGHQMSPHPSAPPHVQGHVATANAGPSSAQADVRSPRRPTTPAQNQGQAPAANLISPFAQVTVPMSGPAAASVPTDDQVPTSGAGPSAPINAPVVTKSNVPLLVGGGVSASGIDQATGSVPLRSLSPSQSVAPPPATGASVPPLPKFNGQTAQPPAPAVMTQHSPTAQAVPGASISSEPSIVAGTKRTADHEEGDAGAEVKRMRTE